MRFLALFGALLLLGAPAFAGWNIQQKDTGATLWVDEDGNSVPVGGGSVINVRIADLSTAATEYIISRKEGKIVALYAVSMSPGSGGTAQDNEITLQLSGLNNGAVASTSYFEQVSGASVTLSAQSAVGTWELDTSNIDEPASGAGDPATDVVLQGRVIAINTSGAGTGTTPAMITIVVE
jgi:hypothetical protein